MHSRSCFTIESACDCIATRVALQLCLYNGVIGTSNTLLPFFFQKTDLFEEKVTNGIHILDYIRDYPGPHFDLLLDFFRKLFIDVREDFSVKLNKSTQMLPTLFILLAQQTRDE